MCCQNNKEVSSIFIEIEQKVNYKRKEKKTSKLINKIHIVEYFKLIFLYKFFYPHGELLKERTRLY